MIVKNYTTSIKVEKTISEIESLLVRFGATGIYKEYKGTNVSGLIFNMDREGQTIPFKIPVNLEKCRTIIQKAVYSKKLPQRYLNEPLRTEQGERIVWRIIKDWIHSQLSLLEIEFAEATEIFLPYAYNPVENKTMYQKFLENKEQFLALSHNEDSE